MPPQLQQLPLSPPPTTMITNHQNQNQITNPNPQPHHHSPPTTGKRKRKTTLQNQNQIINPQPHHHQQLEKEKEKQPPRETHAIRDPHRTLSWWPMPIYPQCRCPRQSETHEPRPTKSNHLAVKLYLHIGGNTPKAKWIYCPVVFGLWSSTYKYASHF